MMLLEKLAPNILSKPDEFLESCLQTLYMVLFSGGIAFVIGLAFGVILTVTRKGGILQNTAVYAVLDKAINPDPCDPFCGGNGHRYKGRCPSLGGGNDSLLFQAGGKCAGSAGSWAG